MTKYKLEYIWLDGYKPVPNLRGKTQIKEFESFPTLEQLPFWGFDGSSTMQAEGRSSDCVLKPVALYPDPARTNGGARHVRSDDARWRYPASVQNARATILDDEGAWFGFEQEYFFYKDGRPLGFPEPVSGTAGPYYTGVGFKNVGDVAREIVEEHLDLCLAAGINHEGINAKWPRAMGFSRCRQGLQEGCRRSLDGPLPLLQRLTEKYGVDVEYHCKPLGDTDWNGSGMHCNFSTTYMREVGGKAISKR